MFLSTWEWIRLLGFLAYFYFTISILFGLIRKTPTIQGRKNLYFQLHQISGWLGFIAVIAHMLLLIIDQYEPYQLVEILIPFMASYESILSGLGSIAFYLFLIVIVTSDLWLQKLGFSAWKKLHILVLPSWIISLIHGIFIGTDSNNAVIQLFYGLTVAIIVLVGIVRAFSEGGKKKESELKKKEITNKVVSE